MTDQSSGDIVIAACGRCTTEISRLRAEVERLKATPFVVDDRNRDLLAELHDEEVAHGATLRQVDRLRAENERLREAVQAARFYVERWNLAQADDDSRRWLIQNSAAVDEEEPTE